MKLLHALGLGARVIRAVALQQINHAPHAKASAQSNNEGLQSVDCRSEKLPYKPPFLRGTGNKKAALSGGRLQTSGHFVPKRLCKGVWIVDVVIVEDVLVLACERIVRHSPPHTSYTPRSARAACGG